MSPQSPSKLTLRITSPLLALRTTERTRSPASPHPQVSQRAWQSLHPSPSILASVSGPSALLARSSENSQILEGGMARRGPDRAWLQSVWLHSKKNIPGVRYRQGVSPKG